MSVFVARNADGLVYGRWACRQFPGQEELPDDHPDVLTPVATEPMTIAIESPRGNQVFQHTAGVASFKVAWRGLATSVQLKGGATLIAASATGEFRDIPPGWYRVRLMQGGNEIDSISIGVGDVFAVAGQSNATSPADKPGDAVLAFAKERCVVSDYHGQGFFTFKDAGANLLTAGVCWIRCANTLARGWPVMFVIVSEGSTSTQQWMETELRKRLCRAIFEFKPKAILWCQGETDCGLRMTDSYTYMKRLVDAVRQVDGVPWIVARNSYPPTPEFPPPPEGWPVRFAQQRLIDEEDNVYQGPDTDPIRRQDEVHFYQPNLQTIGNGWASAISAAGL